MIKKVMKKVTAILTAAMLLCSTLLFTACGELAKIDEDCYVNNSISLQFSEGDYEKLTKNINSLRSAIENESASEIKFVFLALKTAKALSELVDAMNLSRVYYYSDITDTETYGVYNDLSAKCNTVYNAYRGLFEPAYHSQYKEIFFGDMTDAEIEELLASFVVSDDVVKLNNQITDIQARFNAFSEEEIMGEEHDELFTELIETENELAAYNGYDNYMDYCYDNVYYRDYTPADSAKFAGSLKENLLPAAESAKVRLETGKQNLSLEDKNAYLNVFESGSFDSKENRALLDGFYRSLGDEVYSVYKRFMSKGYYYIAKSQNAYQGAFTGYYSTKNEPYIYFSQSYATPITFVHEFGHYCNFYLTDTDESSFDLAETHSQGAEWLFIGYLKEVWNSNLYSYAVNAQFAQTSISIVLCSLVGVFETEVFEADLSDAEFNFDETMNALTEEIIGVERFTELYPKYTPVQYYRYVVINSSGYYISYAVSLISALEYYVLAQENYAEAAATYRNMLNYSTDYQDTLKEIGLLSPFEADTFSAIAEAFAKV